MDPHSRLEFGTIPYKKGGFVGKVFSVILTYPAWWRKHTDLKQDAQLSQRDCAAGCVIVFAKSRRKELGTGRPYFYGHYRSIFNHCDIIGTNRKPVCDFLLVINSNWHPISYRFGVIAAYCSNFAPTRSLWLKISGTRGPPPIIFAQLARPMNALQLCRWQFSHKATL